MDEKIEHVVKAGTKLLITWGVYDDFSVQGNFIVIKDFDYANEYLNFNKKLNSNENLEVKYYRFSEYLEGNGFIERLVFSELWLGRKEGTFYPDSNDHTDRIEF